MPRSPRRSVEGRHYEARSAYCSSSGKNIVEEFTMPCLHIPMIQASNNTPSFSSGCETH